MNALTRFPRRLATCVPWLVVLVLVSMGCGAASRDMQPPSRGTAPQQGGSSAGSQSSQETADQASPDRMIVRTVSLSLAVTDVDAALDGISQVASEYGGFVLSADSNESDGKRIGKASLRVSSDKLDEAIGRIKMLAKQVRRSSTNAKDVTDQYVDQDARLRNLQATEAQYLQVLSTAKTIDEILAVRKVLSDVRDQIERTQAQLQLLRRTTEMATISVDLDTATAAQSLRVGEWDLAATVHEAVQALITIVAFLVKLVISIVILGVIWLPALLLFLWWRRRVLRKPATPPSAAG